MERGVHAIETDRLRLRPLTPADRAALFAIYADPRVRRFLLVQPRSLEEFREPFRLMIELSATLGMWMIIDKADRRPIGRCGFYPYGPGRMPELAYLLAPPYWHRGLATEAARACLDYAFVGRHWAEVVAMVRPEHRASARVLEKIGMRRLRTIQVRGQRMEFFSARASAWAA